MLYSASASQGPLWCPFNSKLTSLLVPIYRSWAQWESVEVCSVQSVQTMCIVCIVVCRLCIVVWKLCKVCIAYSVHSATLCKVETRWNAKFWLADLCTCSLSLDCLSQKMLHQGHSTALSDHFDFLTYFTCPPLIYLLSFTFTIFGENLKLWSISKK